MICTITLRSSSTSCKCLASPMASKLAAGFGFSHLSSLKDAQKRAKRVLCQNTCILGIAECSRGRQRRPYLQYGESPIPAAQLWPSKVASKICKLFVPAITRFLSTSLDQSCLRLASRDCLQAHDLAVAGCTLVQSNF